MTEKQAVTIDQKLIIHRKDVYEEKLFENQHVRLVGRIKCYGKLVFKDCVIEPLPDMNNDDIEDEDCKPGCIFVGYAGELEMDGCEVIHPGYGFLCGGGGILGRSVITIKNTAFLLPQTYYGVINCRSDELCFIGCSFVEERIEWESQNRDWCYLILSDGNPIMEKCTFQNIAAKITAKSLIECSFDGCRHIDSEQTCSSTFNNNMSIRCKEICSSTFAHCDDITGLNISSSVFQNCGRIEVRDDPTKEEPLHGSMKDCSLTQVKTVWVARADVKDCKFQAVKAEGSNDCVGCYMYLSPGKLVHCSFDDAEMTNDAYLIITHGYGSGVEDCQFTNCRTDREDSELYVSMETLNARFREQEQQRRKEERREAFKNGGLLRGALGLLGSAARSATGVALDIAQEAGDMDKFKKRYEEEQKKFEREQHKQK